MSLWMRVTLRDSTEPDSAEHVGLINLERALWIEAGEGDEEGTLVHFGADETLAVTESVEEIVDLLDGVGGEEEEILAVEGDSED